MNTKSIFAILAGLATSYFLFSSREENSAAVGAKRNNGWSAKSTKKNGDFAILFGKIVAGDLEEAARIYRNYVNKDAERFGNYADAATSNGDAVELSKTYRRNYRAMLEMLYA